MRRPFRCFEFSDVRHFSLPVLSVCDILWEMLAVGLGESKDSSLDFPLEDIWVNPIKEVNHLVYNLFQGDQEHFSLASLDEEAIEVDHLLVEQHISGTLDDGVMYLSSNSLENCLGMDGTPGNTWYYDQGDNNGILGADAEQVGKQALKYEFMLQGIEENENSHTTCNLSCDCSDFLLESGSAENLLFNYPSNGETTVRNMTDRGADGVKSVFTHASKTFTVAKLDHTTVPQCTTEVHVSHDALHITDCLNVSLEDQRYLKHELLFDQQNLTGLVNDSEHMETAFNEDDLILIPGNEMSERVFSSLLNISPSGALVTSTAKDEISCVDGQTALIKVSQGTHGISERTNDSFITTKRLRKPTRRYIEETSETKGRCSYDRLKMSLITSKENFLHARTEEKYHWSEAVQLLNQNYSGRLQSLRARRRKTAKQLGSSDDKGYILPPKITSTIHYSELQDDASDESATTNCNRRKHHRQWKPSEVVKLVDGVSHFGVGRWTEIKKLCFSTSAHRTAVDLKDKWRNLLRAASVADSENRNLAEAQKKHHASAHLLPQAILQQVKELSIIHPYPRSQKFRIAELPADPPISRTRRRNSDASAILRSGVLHSLSFSH